MRKIKDKLREESERNELKNIEDIEKTQNDSNKMFIALRKMNRNKPKGKIFVKDGEGIIENEEEVTNLVTAFFQEMFQSKAAEPNFEIKLCKMTKPFTTMEVENVIKKLKNNKSPGSGNLSAELLKNSPSVVHEYIPEILNKWQKPVNTLVK